MTVELPGAAGISSISLDISFELYYEWGIYHRGKSMEIRLNKKIMFVDDELFMQEIWNKTLTEEGYEVIAISTAEECLELCEKEKPDLIITDILLPHMDGLALCEEVRKRDSLCDIPIILITGVFRDLNFRSRISQSTAEAFFLKPLDKEEVLKKISEVLNR